MTELNEQQEREMIEKAKAGDPEANYQMSLWALDQAMAEPEEDRWNRLAAKCLVKAAEAGYAPAKAKMDELLQAAEAKNAQASARPAAKHPDAKVTPDEPLAPAITSEQLGKVAGQAGEAAKKAGKAAGKAAVKAGSALASGASSLAKKAKEGIAKASEARAAAAEAKAANQEAKAAEAAAKAAVSGADGPADSKADVPEGAVGGSHTRKKSAILPDFSQWDDAKWKKMQIICIIVCVILALLIAALVISGNRRRNKAATEEPTIQIPVAEVAATPGPTNAPAPAAGQEDTGETTAPAPAEGTETAGAENDGTEAAESTPTAQPAEDYPPQDILDEIQAASLDVYPEDSDYVDGAKTVTVSTQGSALNMRRGPGSNYSLVNAMPNGTQVSVYANKNGWGLVKYDNTWGWCSYDYLKS